jgi:hypothetical protein
VVCGRSGCVTLTLVHERGIVGCGNTVLVERILLSGLGYHRPPLPALSLLQSHSLKARTPTRSSCAAPSLFRRPCFAHSCTIDGAIARLVNEIFLVILLNLVGQRMEELKWEEGDVGERLQLGRNEGRRGGVSIEVSLRSVQLCSYSLGMDSID